MASNSSLSAAQKHELCTVMLLGCDRITAQNYLGISAAQLRLELEQDPAFAQKLSRAEAMAELRHMKNVHEAAQDEKNWRTSVWWLERRAPERFGRRDPVALTATQWKSLVEELVEVISQEVTQLGDRQRVVNRLLQVTEAAAASIISSQVHAALPAPEEDSEQSQRTEG